MNTLIEYSKYHNIVIFDYVGTDEYLTYYTNDQRWKLVAAKNNIVFYRDLSCIQEEEYFQLSLVWGYKFPIETVKQIMQVSRSCNYDFNIVKNILVHEGVIT